MKKSFKLFAAAIFALTSFVSAQAVETLTVCDANNTSNYVPFWNQDFQSTMHSQLIYPADMLADMSGQQINSVTFFLKDDGLYADGGMLVIKMGETDNPTYASASDFRTNLVQVAAMPLSQGVMQLVIELTTPYNYQGGNLVIDFSNTEHGDDNFYGWNSWYGLITSNHNAINSRGELATFLPKAAFDYGVPQEWEATVTPEELTFNLPAEREEVQTITVLNKGLNAFTPVISSVAEPFSIDVQPVELAMGHTLEILVKFAPTVPGSYTETITIDCGDAGSFQVVVNATATDPVYEVVVGDKTTSDGYLPLYCYYLDEVGTLGQMIYTEEMMGAAKGNKITKVTYYNTAVKNYNGQVLQLSFKPVEQDGFTEATALTEFTAVATLQLGNNVEEFLFVLDEPYQYDGGNLAVEVQVIESEGGFNYTSFYGNRYDYNPSFYHYASTNKMSDFLPMTNFTYDKAGTPEPGVRGDVDGNNEVSIADVTALIDILLGSGEPTTAADCNLDGEVGISDVTALIDYLLSGSWAE